MSWLLFGSLSLVWGTVRGAGEDNPELYANNPVYTTGQTWLGIALSAGYVFFGVNEDKQLKNKTTADASNTGNAQNDDDSANANVTKPQEPGASVV